jgi:hypothetical protein
MLSVHDMMAAIEPRPMEGLSPEDVMRHYLKDRAETLGRERVAKLLGIGPKALDHITSGRRGISMREVVDASGERSLADVFHALAKLVEKDAEGEIVIKRLPADAVAVGRKKHASVGGPPRDPTTTGGAVPKARPSKRSPDRSRPQSAAPAPSGRDR